VALRGPLVDLLSDDEHVRRLRRILQAAHWRLYARVYDHLWDTAYTEAVARTVASVCLQLRARRILEVGAGTGLFTQVLDRELDAVLDVSEPLPDMRERLRRRLPHVAVTGLPLESLHAVMGLTGTAGNVEGMRVVLAANVLHLLDEPSAGLECLRSLAGGSGHVVVVTPVPTAGLGPVARAMLRSGVSTPTVIRFVIIHLVMAPLTIASGLGRDPAPAFALARTMCWKEEVVGASAVLVVPGHARPPT
jgi:SAM-dependent methyltransferase